MKYLLPVIVIVMVIAPAISQAVDYLPLAACGLKEQPTDASGNRTGDPSIDYTKACSTCDFYRVLKNAGDFGLYMLLPSLLILFLVIGGILMILGAIVNDSWRLKGLRIIKNTLIGALIALTAWLLLTTLAKLLAPNQSDAPWYILKCEKLEEVFKVPESAIKEKAFYWTYGRLPEPETIPPESSQIDSTSVTATRGLKCAGGLQWRGSYSGLTAEKIDAILRGAKSPMAGSGNNILAAAQKYNIDPALALAVWIKDSSMGTAGVGSYIKNPGNVTAGINERVSGGKGCFISNSTRDTTIYSTNNCPGGCAGDRSWFCYDSWAVGAADWFRYADLYKRENTVNTFISTYAPNNENNTRLYIDQVCERIANMSVDKNKVLQSCGCR